MVPVWKLFWFPQLRCGARKHTVKISFLRQCGKKNHPTFTSLGKIITKKDGWPKMTSEKNMVGQNPPGEGGHEAVLRWKKKVVNGHLDHKDHHHQSSWSSSSSSSSLANQWKGISPCVHHKLGPHHAPLHTANKAKLIFKIFVFLTLIKNTHFKKLNIFEHPRKEY